MEWPAPKSVEEVRSFLGTVGYYRRFVRMFSELSHPITSLLQKGVAFSWGAAQQSAFEQLKSAMSQQPVLILPDPSRPYTVTTDASGFAVGATLSQDHGHGLQPIAFLSKKMLPAERNYPVHEQELLAIIVALRSWRHYLHGAPFSIVTDHKSLQYFQSQPHLSARQTRWLDLMAEFDFKIQYVEGKDNVVADGLSRRPDHKSEQGRSVASMQLASMDTRAQRVAEGPVAVRLESAELKSAIVTAYQLDPACKELLNQLPHSWRVVDGLLVNSSGQVLLPRDAALKCHVLMECHDSPTGGGHLGSAKTIERVSRLFTWSGLHADVKRYVSTCLACQANKPSTQLPMGPLQPLPIPERPWEVVTMDLITQLPRTQDGHDAIVVFVDKLTKLTHYCACTTNIDAPGLATLFLQEVVRHHGLPLAIVSDRDPRFTSIFWRALWSQLGTRLAMSTAYHPQTDGQTERQNRTLEEMLRSYVSARQDDWDRHLLAAEIAYNNSEQASTGTTPFYLNSGQHPRFALEAALHPHAISNNPAAADRVSQMHTQLSHAKEALMRAQARQARYADERRREVTLKVGDRVWLSTEHLQLKDPSSQSKKLLSKFIGPYPILRAVGPVAYELQLPNELRVHPVFHVSKLKALREGGSDEFPGRSEVESAWSRPAAEFIADDGTEEYEVESILSKRTRRIGRNGRIVEYLVKWRGYPSYEATWEPVRHLDHAQTEVEAFEARSSRIQQERSQ
jgi:hypothetical protein